MNPRKPNDAFKNKVLGLMKTTLNSPYGEGNSVYQRFMNLLIETYPIVEHMSIGDRSTMIAWLYNNVLLPYLTGEYDYDFEKDTSNFRKDPTFQEGILDRYTHVRKETILQLMQLELQRWFAYFANKEKANTKNGGSEKRRKM
jgi:hypothetical protein